jgi:hypothetical protein
VGIGGPLLSNTHTPNYMSFKVPVSVYVKKYLVKKFFAGHKGPYKIEEDSLLGKQFMANIIDGRKHDFIDTHIEVTEHIEVILSQDMMARSPKQSKLRSINFFLDKIYKEGLIDWVIAAKCYGTRPYAATRDFLEFYGIDNNEYSHDAAYKLWQRYNKQENKVSHPSPKTRSAKSVRLTDMDSTPCIDLTPLRPAA